jgi:hypothetical protein
MEGLVMKNYVNYQIASMAYSKGMRIERPQKAYSPQGTLMSYDHLDNPLPAPLITEVYGWLSDKGFKIWITPSSSKDSEKKDTFWNLNMVYIHPKRGVVFHHENVKTGKTDFILALQEGIKHALKII